MKESGDSNFFEQYMFYLCQIFAWKCRLVGVISLALHQDFPHSLFVCFEKSLEYFANCIFVTAGVFLKIGTTQCQGGCYFINIMTNIFSTFLSQKPLSFVLKYRYFVTLCQSDFVI